MCGLQYEPWGIQDGCHESLPKSVLVVRTETITTALGDSDSLYWLLWGLQSCTHAHTGLNIYVHSHRHRDRHKHIQTHAHTDTDIHMQTDMVTRIRMQIGNRGPTMLPEGS